MCLIDDCYLFDITNLQHIRQSKSEGCEIFYQHTLTDLSARENHDAQAMRYCVPALGIEGLEDAKVAIGRLIVARAATSRHPWVQLRTVMTAMPTK